jgi:hypothetical protein
MFSVIVGLDSSVGIATRYELDGPGIESQLGARFSAPSRPALGLTVLSGGKAAGSWRRPTPSSAEFKERVELFVYSSRVNFFYVHCAYIS